MSQTETIKHPFTFTTGSKLAIIEGLEWTGTRQISEIYYDNDFSLLKQGIWLYTRNGFGVLEPTPINGKTQEITDAKEICKRLGIPTSFVILDETLKQNGYSPFCSCKTTRERYQRDNFKIMFDETVFKNGFKHKMGELEVVVKEEEKKQAEQGVRDAAFDNGLSLGQSLHKIVEYAKVCDPDLYAAIEQAGFY